MTRDEFSSLLAEGVHTAFRKATDCHQATPIHRLISEMPNEEWGSVIDWVVDGLFSYASGDLHVTRQEHDHEQLD